VLTVVLVAGPAVGIALAAIGAAVALWCAGRGW